MASPQLVMSHNKLRRFNLLNISMTSIYRTIVNAVSRYRLGLSKKLKRFFLITPVTHGILWGVFEPLRTFFPEIPIRGWTGYASLIVVSCLAGIVACFSRNLVLIKIPNSDSSITVKFGDIFDAKGLVVIPVNEFFDSELGVHVSKTSIHGQFVIRVEDAEVNDLKSLLTQNISSNPLGEVNRNTGRNFKYPIGTYSHLDVSVGRFLLVALSKTDVDTLKASATIRDLWECFEGTWDGSRIHSNGEPVYVPLFGSGLSGVGLPPKMLVNLILTSFLYYTKKAKIADHVTLVLPMKFKHIIDLEAVKRSVKNAL